jgi:plasmid stabilization system protein ParE
MSGDTQAVAPSVSRWLRFSAWLGRIWRALINAFTPPEPEPLPFPEPVAPPPPPPPPPPSARLNGRRNVSSPLTVPASGYIFTFRVHATLHWTASDLYPEQFGSLIEHFQPYAVRRLTAIAAGLSRRHDPHRAREYEVELQERLDEIGEWRYSRGAVTIYARPHVWVELEERVKEAVQPYREELIKLDCEHDVQMKRAEYAEKLSRHWTTILTDLAGSPFADGAAEMTEKEFADVVRKIVADRKAAAEKVDDLLRTRAETSGDFEHLEYFDQLKRRLEREEERLFAEASGGVPPEESS